MRNEHVLSIGRGGNKPLADIYYLTKGLGMLKSNYPIPLSDIRRPPCSISATF